MNKKLMLLPLFAVLIVGTVFALGYYGVFSQTMEVESSIEFSEGCTDDLGLVFDGSTFEGTACAITNNAPSEREVQVTNDAPEGIDVEYIGTLELSKKDSEWQPTGEPISVGYTIIGDTFEVTGVEDGYTAIYYKDGVVGLEGRLENPQPAISIDSVTVLPEEDDFNMDELANYCAEPDNYNQCKGAKLWVVPTTDITEGTLNWANMANYFYELDLIQYNSEGNLVLSPESEMVLTPVYTISPGVTGEQIVETTIA